MPDYPNRPLAPGAANVQPSEPVDATPSAPLILIAFSGGGSRAAALGLGVLDELRDATYPGDGAPVKLVDRIKVVSSVSGGSVVAAWFSLVGPDRMDEMGSRFLERDNMTSLELQAVNPLTLARLAFGHATRIGVMQELFDKELFETATFSNLPRSRFLVMNATDMESGEVFAFTPQRFDDICSDLGALPISVGVAASAAFPVALSPMSLRNYSYAEGGCPGARPTAAWIGIDLTKPNARFLNLEEFKRARYANALRNGAAAAPYRNEHYLHLLDGGLADNQGIQSLSDALISAHSAAHLLPAINDGKARRIVVISVNARSDTDSGTGADAAEPGLLEVIKTVIGTPIDATTAYANATITELVSTLQSAGATASLAPGDANFASLHVYGIPIDFDQFRTDQAALQSRLKQIGTSWTLSRDDVRDTIAAGRLLLRQHPCYQRLLLDIRGPGLAANDAETRRNCPFDDDPG